MLFLFWAPAQSIVFPEIKHQGVFNIIFFIRPGNTPYLYSLSSSFCCSSEHFMTLAKFKLISYFSVLSTSLAGQLTGACLGTFLGEEPAEEPTDVSSQDPQIPTGIPAEPRHPAKGSSELQNSLLWHHLGSPSCPVASGNSAGLAAARETESQGWGGAFQGQPQDLSTAQTPPHVCMHLLGACPTHFPC